MPRKRRQDDDEGENDSKKRKLPEEAPVVDDDGEPPKKRTKPADDKDDDDDIEVVAVVKKSASKSSAKTPTRSTRGRTRSKTSAIKAAAAATKPAAATEPAAATKPEASSTKPEAAAAPATAEVTAAEIASPKEAVQPIQKLRIPSHQTPGKALPPSPRPITAVTADAPTTTIGQPPTMRLNLNAAAPMDDPAPQARPPSVRPITAPTVMPKAVEKPTTDTVGNPPMRLNLNTAAAKDPAPSKSPDPSPKVLQVQPPRHSRPNPEIIEILDDDDDVEEETESSSSWLDYSLLWIVVLFVFQYYSGGTYGKAAAFLLGIYRGSSSSTVDPTYNATAEEERHEQAAQQIRRQIELMSTNKARLKKARTNLMTELNDLQFIATELQTMGATAKVPWLDDLEQTTEKFEHLLHKDEYLSAYTIADMQDLVDPVASRHILDLSTIDLWNISTVPSSSNNCAQAPGVTEGDVVDAVRALQERIRDNTLQMLHDDRVRQVIVDWVNEDKIRERFSQPIVIESDRPPPRRPRGSSLSSIRKVLAARWDVEAADRTGKVDYALLAHGAAVLQASPSLVDTLPYGNRLAQTLGLRFYGFGPEMALTPTYPADALGQCWSIAASQMPAQLTVRLSQPVYATHVVLEHPPGELTDRVKTAVRHFRLQGFESPDGDGRPWNLGRFEFAVPPSGLQTFFLLDEMDGQDIPAIHSITLLMESNWGMAYTCLYRFRVQGYELETEEEDDDDGENEDDDDDEEEDGDYEEED